MLMAYVLSSRLITPYLRLATKQRVRYGRRINMIADGVSAIHS